jgi:hypothetical protein
METWNNKALIRERRCIIHKGVEIVKTHRKDNMNIISAGTRTGNGLKDRLA